MFLDKNKFGKINASVGFMKKEIGNEPSCFIKCGEFLH